MRQLRLPIAPQEAILAQNEIAFKAFNDKALVRCQYCERTFLPEKLAIHHKSCTPDNPARRVGEPLPGGGGMPIGLLRAGAQP